MHAGAERLGTGLLGGEALGIGRHQRARRLGAALGLGALDVGEDTGQKALAMAFHDLLDPADVDQVGADADDHAEYPIRERPRSIAARIVRTDSARPTKIASPIMK